MSVQAEVNTDTTVQNKAAKVNEEVPKQEKQPYTGTEKPPEETLEQINWRKFRQVREIERKAKEESDRKAIDKTAEAEALKAAMESLLNRPQAQQQVHDELDETEDQRIEKKVNQALKAERQRNDQERAQREAAELPQKLSNTYSDFNAVCTQENLDYLEFHYPEVATPYKLLPDSFDKWANIYKAVKRFIPNTDSKKDMARMEKNLSKPQSMSSPGATQTGDHAPSELSDKRRQDNWSRMQRIMKGAK